MDSELIENLIKKYNDHPFTKLIKNKRVCLVGPDTNLIGKKKGSEINKYDLIIRFNNAFDFLPFESKVARDFGKRTDIIYLAPTNLKHNSNIKALKKFRDNNIKAFCYQNGNRDNIYFTGNHCYSNELKYLKTLMPKYAANCRPHYSHHTAQALVKMLSQIGERPLVPRTGFLALFDMIVHQAKEIKIIGMSFYHGGGNAFRLDAKDELDPLENHKGEICAHDSKLELALLRDFLNEFPQITIETDLKEKIEKNGTKS